VMDEPLPVGLGLRVPPPISSGTIGLQQPTSCYVDNMPSPAVPASTVPGKFTTSADGLCEFDELDLNQVRIYSLLVKDRPDKSIR